MTFASGFQDVTFILGDSCHLKYFDVSVHLHSAKMIGKLLRSVVFHSFQLEAAQKSHI